VPGKASTCVQANNEYVTHKTSLAAETRKRTQFYASVTVLETIPETDEQTKSSDRTSDHSPTGKNDLNQTHFRNLVICSCEVAVTLTASPPLHNACLSMHKSKLEYMSV